MKKVLLLGLKKDEDKILEKLQDLGLLHIEPLQETKSQEVSKLEESLSKTEKALEILEPYIDKKEESKKEDIKIEKLEEIIEKIVETNKKIKEKQREIEENKEKLKKLRNWGEFSSKLIEELEKKRVIFQFWKVPPKHINKIPKENIIKQNKIQGLFYITTLSYNKRLDFQEIKEIEEYNFNQGTKEIENKIKTLEQEIIQLKEEIKKNTPYISLIKDYLLNLKDSISYNKVKTSLFTNKDIFGIKAWIPEEYIEKFKKGVQDLPVGYEIRDPEENEEPPTLIKNPKWIQSILDIIKLYAIPGYKEWDPSASVYFAFAVFFSMIVGDGGYGLIILSIILYFRKKLLKSEVGERVYRLFVTLGISCIIFGALSCTWFAIPISKIPKDSPFAFLKYLEKLKILDTSDNKIMMDISIYAGCIHLSIARIVQIIRLWGTQLWISELGWIILIWGGLAKLQWHYPNSMYIILTGITLILLFSETSFNPIKRIIGGLLNLLGITQNFADILSYLRLFALGIATTVMGGIFNTMGLNIYHNIGGIIGIIGMILVIFIGHTINIILAIMGGFIHGLRLNFLEFYRYCFEGTGYDYQPFLKIGAKHGRNY